MLSSGRGGRDSEHVRLARSRDEQPTFEVGNVFAFLDPALRIRELGSDGAYGQRREDSIRDVLAAMSDGSGETLWWIHEAHLFAVGPNAPVNGHQELTHLGHEDLTHPGSPRRVALTS